jgi:hypothetical protein
LSNNSIITHITLSGTNIDDRGVAILAAGLREGLQAKLVSLNLDGNGIHQAAPLCEILRKTSRLTELNLADNNLR